MLNGRIIPVKFAGCPNTLCSKIIWTVKGQKECIVSSQRQKKYFFLLHFSKPETQPLKMSFYEKERKKEESRREERREKEKKIRRGKIAEMCKMYLNLCQAYQQN